MSVMGTGGFSSIPGINFPGAASGSYALASQKGAYQYLMLQEWKKKQKSLPSDAQADMSDSARVGSEDEKRRRMLAGRASTILTGPRGAGSTLNPNQGKSLLGT